LPRAFTLLEVLVAMVILAVLASGLAIPLAAQVELRRQEATRRQLDEAKEALLGFAAAHGRLPCPASSASRGLESFAAGGDSANGLCSGFYDGYLPAAALGLAPLDGEGFLRDAWGAAGNRVRYAVSGIAVNGVANALTRANGMQAATLAGLGSASHFLFICASGTGATASGCGPATNQLTRKAAFVLLSLGADAGATPPPAATPPATSTAMRCSSIASRPMRPRIRTTTSCSGSRSTSWRAGSSRRAACRDGL
jgi:prepilin-type N-terminal cleavage/methylation domain-containing protein